MNSLTTVAAVEAKAGHAMVLDVGMALPQPNDIAGKSRLR
jgi:hypothetical protein